MNTIVISMSTLYIYSSIHGRTVVQQWAKLRQTGKQAAPYSTAGESWFLSDCAVDWLPTGDWQTRVRAKR